MHLNLKPQIEMGQDQQVSQSVAGDIVGDMLVTKDRYLGQKNLGHQFSQPHLTKIAYNKHPSLNSTYPHVIITHHQGFFVSIPFSIHTTPFVSTSSGPFQKTRILIVCKSQDKPTILIKFLAWINQLAKAFETLAI